MIPTVPTFLDDDRVRDAADPAESVQGFAALLRARTALVHREAERAGFISDLIRGRATRRGYALFLRNLVPAYRALEDALAAHRDHPVLHVFAKPGLRRLPALSRDLDTIAGADWPERCELLPEAVVYGEAVTAAADDAMRLLAHAYARYLGDLSGGQILKPILARTLGLGPEALAFYDFPEVDDIAAAKAGIRDALDAVPMEAAVTATIIAEAIAAFRHNIAVSRAVQTASG